MEKRKIGRSPLEVSAVGLGLMSMSGVYGKPDDAQSIAVIQKALDLGVSFLDSSDMYGWGQNEELLGKALTDAGVLRDALDAYRRGIEVAERRGDKQAAREMAVFARRLEKQLQS